VYNLHRYALGVCPTPAPTGHPLTVDVGGGRLARTWVQPAVVCDPRPSPARSSLCMQQFVDHARTVARLTVVVGRESGCWGQRGFCVWAGLTAVFFSFLSREARLHCVP
jgi:hypothetical protein